MEKLRDKAWVEAHGHTASIMDYARFNYVAQPEDGIGERGLFPRIGDYDKWAIKWGYQYRPEFKDEFEEKEQLMTETTKVLAANPRLWFGGEGRNEDPRAQTEDLGDDNVKASDYGVKNLQRLVANLPQWTRQPNDQYDDLREMYNSARQQFARYFGHVAKNIGGRYINNMPGKEPYELVPAERQKAALDYFGRQVFDAPLWLYPAEITSKTGVDAATEIAKMQASALNATLSLGLLNAIYNNSQASPTAYRLENYLDDLFAKVWTPLDATQELKNSSRRALQRKYVERLNAMLNPEDKDKAAPNAPAYNTDAMLFVAQHLDKLDSYLQAQAQAATGINALHYADLSRQVKQIKTLRERGRNAR